MKNQQYDVALEIYNLKNQIHKSNHKARETHQNNQGKPLKIAP